MMANNIKYKKLIFRGLGVAIIATALAVNFSINNKIAGWNFNIFGIKSQANAACEYNESVFHNNGRCFDNYCYRIGPEFNYFDGKENDCDTWLSNYN